MNTRCSVGGYAEYLSDSCKQRSSCVLYHKTSLKTWTKRLLLLLHFHYSKSSAVSGLEDKVHGPIPPTLHLQFITWSSRTGLSLPGLGRLCHYSNFAGLGCMSVRPEEGAGVEWCELNVILITDLCWQSKELDESRLPRFPPTRFRSIRLFQSALSPNWFTYNWIVRSGPCHGVECQPWNSLEMWS